MDSNYAFYCFHKLRLLPSQFLNLPLEEKAFIMAAIDIRCEDEAEKQREIERNAKK